MKTPRQFLSERYPWLNLADSLAVAGVLLVVIVAIWPHSRLVIDLVMVTAIPGSIAAIVWALTFWQKGRVQIGRLKLRYKSVRRSAGLAALLCLPFLLLQQASIYLRGPNILRERRRLMLRDSRSPIRSLPNGRFASSWRSLISKATTGIR